MISADTNPLGWIRDNLIAPVIDGVNLWAEADARRELLKTEVQLTNQLRLFQAGLLAGTNGTSPTVGPMPEDRPAGIDPTWLVLGGAAVFAAIILLRR